MQKLLPSRLAFFPPASCLEGKKESHLLILPAVLNLGMEQFSFNSSLVITHTQTLPCTRLIGQSLIPFWEKWWLLLLYRSPLVALLKRVSEFKINIFKGCTVSRGQMSGNKISDWKSQKLKWLWKMSRNSLSDWFWVDLLISVDPWGSHSRVYASFSRKISLLAGRIIFTH